MDNFLIKTSFFVLGILAVQGLAELPNVWLTALLFCCLPFSYKKAGLLFCFLIGFVWAACFAQVLLKQQLSQSIEAQPILIKGKIVDLPDKQPDATRFTFEVSEVVGEFENPPDIKRIRLGWYRQAQNVKAGEQWQLLVKLKRPHGAANPHGFDFEKWLFQQRIGATGYVKESKNNVRLDPASPWQLSYWRESIRDYLELALSGSKQLGVIKALVLGDRSDISAEQWAVFRRTGTSHLMAISGLHIGLVTGLVFAFVKWFALLFNSLRISPIRLAIIAGLVAAVCYAALAGFSIPTQRALLMISVVMGALYWQRHVTPSRVISVALWLVLIMDPLAVLSAGFWLSFAAVGVISYGLVGRLSQPHFLVQLVKTQFIVALGLLPFVAYFFQQVSIVAPLANVLAVPMLSLLLIPLLLASLLFSLFSSFIGISILNIVDGLFEILWWFLESVSSIEFAQWILPPVPLWAAAIAMLGVLILLMPRNRVYKPLSGFLFLPLLFPLPERSLQANEFDVVLMDVGQGLSVVIHTQQHTLVFDTGAKYNQRSDMASSVVIPYLKGQGIEVVDKLVISHGDNDHAGGVDSMLRELDIKQISTSVPSMFSAAKEVKRCVNGISWNWDGVDFEFLHPSKYEIFSKNNASCVLKVSSNNGSVLLTGDIEKDAEQSLQRYNATALKADVVIAPHHGSSTSSTRGFIKAVSPRVVLYPVGYLNRYGFPKQAVVERYKNYGVQAYDSATSGAIYVRFHNSEPLAVQSYRDEYSAYWNWKQ